MHACWFARLPFCYSTTLLISMQAVIDGVNNIRLTCFSFFIPACLHATQRNAVTTVTSCCSILNATKHQSLLCLEIQIRRFAMLPC